MFHEETNMKKLSDEGVSDCSVQVEAAQGLAEAALAEYKSLWCEESQACSVKDTTQRGCPSELSFFATALNNISQQLWCKNQTDRFMKWFAPSKEAERGSQMTLRS